MCTAIRVCYIVSQKVCDAKHVDRIAPLQAWSVTHRHTASGPIYTRGILYYITQRLILCHRITRYVVYFCLHFASFVRAYVAFQKKFLMKSLKKKKKKKGHFTQKEPDTPAISLFCTQIFISYRRPKREGTRIARRRIFTFIWRAKSLQGILWIPFWCHRDKILCFVRFHFYFRFSIISRREDFRPILVSALPSRTCLWHFFTYLQFTLSIHTNCVHVLETQNYNGTRRIQI